MRKEAFEQMKKELAIISVIFVLTLIAFKIIFLSEDFFVVLRTVTAIFWILVLPGFVIMSYWQEELKFYERLVIGIGVGTALIGLLSYYAGLAGLHVKYHAILLPLVIILAGFIMAVTRKYKPDIKS